MRIKAAISPCPNDVFIFGGLLRGAVKARYAGEPVEIGFEFEDIETLNQGVASTRWELAKISYANFAACRDRYNLLACGGALGRGCGPLLLSNTGGFDPSGEILVPGERTTANFLLDYFLKSDEISARGYRKSFLPFDVLYRRLLASEPCQGVVIHEMRFTYAGDGLHLVRDLGAHWEKHTGYPIPLGAVALASFLEIDFPGITAGLEVAIRSSLDWSYAHPEAALALCREYSQSLSDSVIRAHIDLYVNGFSRDLGADGRAAVAYFLKSQVGFQTT